MKEGERLAVQNPVPRLPGRDRLRGQRGVPRVNGLPGFDIVGLPDAAVKEARERVRSAIKTNGMKFPAAGRA